MFQPFIDLLKEAKKIAVFTHINPDGDALGSSIALKLGLEKLKKEVDVYCDDTIHENYFFLNTKTYYVEHAKKNYDLAIILDCPQLSRIGKFASIYESTPKKAVIDHHLHSAIRADVSVVDTSAGSVGVLIYRLFNELNLTLDKDIAISLYTAISTDTGCFMHNNTTIEAHHIAGNLMEYEFDLEKANFYLFKRKTKAQIALFASALNNLQFHENNKIAIVAINKEDFDKTKTTYVDTVGISAYIAGIDDIDLAILLTETQDNCYLVSFRSSTIDTSVIAKEFLGGGHRNASGCRICGKKDNVINRLLEVSKKELK